MTDHKRTYSQRGDDYLLEAWKVCEKEKPASPGGSTAPKTVYVCSPFRPTAVSEADREAEQRLNIERALKACRNLAMMGIQPLAPHLYFTRFLKDELAAERAAGMQFGLAWLEQADELWVFGDTVSEGMAQEITRAKELGKPVHTIPESGRVEELLVKSLAQKLCAEDKPNPPVMCPYCGHKMVHQYVYGDHFFCCPKCRAVAPDKDTEAEAYAAAMQRWQEPNDYLVRAEVLDRCKQGAEARPLWVEFRHNDQRSRWMVVDTPPTVFGTDTVKNYFADMCEQYGILWRCWLRKPTKKEMEDTPWQS